MPMLGRYCLGGTVLELNMSVESAWKEIEAEHHLLGEKLVAVVHLCPTHESRTDCHGCPHALSHQCSNTLQDMVGELLAYMVSHFHHEEALMRRWGLLTHARDVCDRHMEDHGDISQAFRELAKTLHGHNPLPQVRKLQSLLNAWIGPHMMEHDQPLLALLSRNR